MASAHRTEQQQVRNPRGMAHVVSKKDATERAAELRSQISPALVAAVCEQANELWRDHFAAEVVTETLLHADGRVARSRRRRHGAPC